MVRERFDAFRHVVHLDPAELDVDPVEHPLSLSGARAESRFRTRNPYSVVALGVTKVSRAAPLVEAGPP